MIRMSFAFAAWLSLIACQDQGTKNSRRSLGKSAVASTDIESNPNDSAKILSHFDPQSQEDLKIAVAQGPNAGTRIVVPSHSMAQAVDLIIEPAALLADQSVLSELGLNDSSRIVQAYPGVIVRPAEDIELLHPLTLTLVPPSSLAQTLGLAANRNFVVFYKTFKAGKILTGMIATEGLHIDAEGHISLSGFFGSYWLAELREPNMPGLEVESKEPIFNRELVSIINQNGVRAETEIDRTARNPPVKWRALSLDFAFNTQTLTVDASAEGEPILHDCALELRKNQDDKGSLLVSTGSKLHSEKRDIAWEQVFARFKCLDSVERLTFSDWSKRFSIPAFFQWDLIHSAADGVLNKADQAVASEILGLRSTESGKSWVEQLYRVIPGEAACEWDRPYFDSKLPLANDSRFASGQVFKVCGKFLAADQRLYLGVSPLILSDTDAPVLQSLVLKNGAADGKLEDTDFLQTTPIIGDIVATDLAKIYYAVVPESADCATPRAWTLAVPTVTAEGFGIDGVYKICLRLLDIHANETLAQSARILFDRIKLEYTSTTFGTVLSDKVIHQADSLTGNPLINRINATGYSSAAYSIAPGNQICDLSLAYSNQVPLANALSQATDGFYKICLRLTDETEGLLLAESATFYVDVHAPVFGSAQLDSSLADGYLNLSEFQSVQNLVTSIDASGYSAVQYQPAADSENCSNLASTSGITADGSYKVCVKVMDEAGNASFGGSTAFTVDRTPPVFSAIQLAGFLNDHWLNKAEAETNLPLMVAPNVEALAAISYSLLPEATTCSEQVTFQSNIPTSGDTMLTVHGRYKLCLAFKDAAQNVAYGSSDAFAIDQILPEFQGEIQVLRMPESGQLWVFWNAGTDDFSPRSKLGYAICVKTVEGSCSQQFTRDFVVGTNRWDYQINGLDPQLDYEILVRVLDEAGNASANVSAKSTKALQSVQSLASGSGHNCVLLQDQSVLCWGDNQFGQVGDGTTVSRFAPTTIFSASSGVTALSLGASFSCALFENRTVDCWGSNAALQPQLVPNLSQVVALATGNEHSCAVQQDGSVSCWGRNYDGQLGDGTNSDQHVPVKVLNATDSIQKIFLGYDSSCAVNSDQVTLCWGDNYSKQLGIANGSTINVPTPTFAAGLSPSKIDLGADYGCGLWADGALKCWGSRATVYSQFTGTYDGFSPVDLATNVLDFSLGESHACLLSQDSTVWCWGRNYYGETGQSPIMETQSITKVEGLADIKSVSLGRNHSCAIDLQGRVRCWGSNGSGALGFGFGENRYTPTTAMNSLSGFTKIATGDSHSCALMSDQTVRCWGGNAWGKLGVSGMESRTLPVQVPGLFGVLDIAVGSQHSCAVLSNKSVKCWGLNSSGEFGDGGNGSTYSSTPTLVPNVSDVVTIVANSSYSCALLVDGSVNCWGDNSYGQTGEEASGSSLPHQVPGLSDVTQLDLGTYHACALLGSGTVKCWGYNELGSLGNGSDQSSFIPVPVTNLENAKRVAVGLMHSCALKQDGSMACWGINDEGQMGDGSLENRNTATPVTGLTGVKDMAVSSKHSCAVLSDDQVACWGANFANQLGAPDTVSSQNLPRMIPGLAEVKSLHMGLAYGCAQLNNNEVRCWGRNQGGDFANGLSQTWYKPLRFVSSTN